MRIDRRDGTDERRVLTGLIVDPTVAGHVAKIWDRELFRSKWSNLIAGWCVGFWRNYGEPPGKSIEDIFESWTQKDRDEATVEMISKFLGTLSGEYEQQAEEINGDYLVDLASKHFNRVRLERLSDGIRGDLDAGDLDEALERADGFGRLELGAGAPVDVLGDADAIREAFESKGESIITFPGALGEFYGDALERDAFVAFMAPNKRGKSWRLIDVAWRAMLQRRKVAFFEAGDMSRNQIMRRFMIRASRRPMRARSIQYPVSIEHNDGEFASVEREERKWTKPLDWREAWKACQKIIESKLRSKDLFLRLSCHPTRSLSLDGIKTEVDSWERDGWVPDVIVIDYADILAPPRHIREGRDQINENWMGLRSLSQQFHCLVVTATQSDAQSFDAKTLGQRHFSDDRRKLDHVTGMIGINSSEKEKDRELSRQNWINLREEEFSIRRCVHVASCLSIGNPTVRSCW